MAGANDFLVWDPAGGTITSQPDYAASGTRTNGVVNGLASPELANKAWRQGSTIASMIAQFIANVTNENAVDDGTIATLLTNFMAALVDIIAANAPPPFGVVHDVTGGRGAGVVYTNTTGKTMFVMTSFLQGGGSSLASFLIAGAVVCQNQDVAASGVNFFVPVPPGLTYEVTIAGATLQTWVEIY